MIGSVDFPGECPAGSHLKSSKIEHCHVVEKHYALILTPAESAGGLFAWTAPALHVTLFTTSWMSTDVTMQI